MAEFQTLKPEVRNWDLSSDEKLVSKLDTFLNNIMTQCETVQKNTEMTEYETNAVSVYLEDTFNALSNLSNKKFIENSMAPLEEPQLPAKEPPKIREITPENKQENYSKAIKNAIDIFNITNNDDDDTLTKSHTMSMATMFKSADHLPFIIGSKLFAQDEFLGIIEKTDNIDKYLRGEQFVDVENPNLQASPSSGIQNGIGSANMSSNINGPPRSGFAYPQGATNVIEIRNTTLGPPPPFEQLLEQYESRGGAARRQTAVDTQQRPAAGPAGGRSNFLADIENRSRLNTAQEPQPQRTVQEPQKPQSIQDMLNAQFNQRGAPQPRVQPPPVEPEGANPGRMSEIRNNPLYQPIQTQPQRQTRLFDEEDEVEVGNADLFKSTSQNKRKFDNLLTNPAQGGGAARLSNPMLNPLTANPFDPFGLSNPFMPFNPKPEKAQEIQARQTNKDSLMSLANDIPETKGREEQKEERNERASKLNKLFEDSDEDDETRLNKQKELSQKYRSEAKPKPKVEEKPAAPVAAQKTGGTGGRVSKLFDDEEEDSGFLSKKPQPKKEPVAMDKSTKPAGGKKKLFDDDEEEAQEIIAPVATKKQTPKKEEASTANPLGASEAPRQSKATGKTTKSLFDDDDEGPLMGAKPKKAEPKLFAPEEQQPAPTKKKEKKSLFDDDEPDVQFKPKEVKQPAQPTEPLAARPSQPKEKKSLFNDEDEEPIRPVAKPVIQEVKAPVPVVQEIKKEEQKPEIKPLPRESLPREEPKPEIKPLPRESLPREEPKQEIKPQAVEGFRPMKEDPLFDAPQPTKGVAPPTGAGNDLTKLIKAAQMAKKKKFGDSDEEDSDESEEAPPPRKSIPATTVQSAPPQEKKVEEIPPVREEPKEVPVVKEEVVAPKIEEVKPRVSEEIKPRASESSVKESRVSESPVPVKEESEEARHSVQKQSSNISSRISNLQNQLNLNMGAFMPSEGLPAHMRKSKQSYHEEEPTSSHEPNPTGSEETKPKDVVAMALDKPIKKGVAKKTVMFEDDEEEQEDPLLKKYAAPKPISKPVSKPVETIPVEQPKPKVEATSPLKPAIRNSSPMRSNPLGDPLGDPMAQRPSSPSKNKPKFDDEDDPLAGFNKKPAANPTSDPNNPLNLLKGLKAMDEQKGSKKSVTIRESSKSKGGIFDDEDESPLTQPKKLGGAPPISAPSNNSSNPLALLSGLKEMDAEQGRKSNKPKSKTSDMFDDPLGNKSSKPTSKPKGIFDDEDEGPGFMSRGTASVKPKPVAEKPEVKAKPRESAKLTKLFDDSDEDKGGMFGGGKASQPASKSKAKKPASGLFSDDD